MDFLLLSVCVCVCCPCQAFVFDGDIYYKPSVNAEAMRLTTTGQGHNMVNGISDWTYEGGVSRLQDNINTLKPELRCIHFCKNMLLLSLNTEEVLLTSAAHWWSMDGARLAYLSINNSATPVMEIPQFLGGLYPSNMLFPYPKVLTGRLYFTVLQVALKSALNYLKECWNFRLLKSKYLRRIVI